MHRSNTQTLTQYSTQINEAYTTTMARQSEAQQAHGNATQLLNDVTEAESKSKKSLKFSTDK